MTLERTEAFLVILVLVPKTSTVFCTIFHHVLHFSYFFLLNFKFSDLFVYSTVIDIKLILLVSEVDFDT